MSERLGDEPPSAAEERLLALLALLRAEPRHLDGTVTGSVMRTLQWQLLARSVARAAARLGGSILDGLALVAGAARWRGRP